MIRYGRPDRTGRNLLLAIAFAVGAILGMATTPSRAEGLYIPVQSATGFGSAHERMGMRDPGKVDAGGRDIGFAAPQPARLQNALPPDWRGEHAQLTAWQLRDALRRQGFHRIDFARHRGPVVTATGIDSQGLPVRLKVNAFSGRLIAVARLDARPYGHRDRFLY
ncbi:MAG: hypothetical protein JNM13_10460 [Hyphomicrobiaceae bacterium]|nr:hypothetical protein [Hyphomicrobiaceae bacterium]